MAAYNFQKRYAAAIESGAKRSTIRRRRKNGYLPRPGDVLSLYMGMRTKACRLLRKVAVVSVSQFELEIEPERILSAHIRGIPMRGSEIEKLAIQEGFKDTVDMAMFFHEKYGGSLTDAYLIEWDPQISVG